MIPLLKRVTVLLLTTVTIGVITFSDSNVVLNESCQTVESNLNKLQNVRTCVNTNTTDEQYFTSCGNMILDAAEKLVTSLVFNTDTYSLTSLHLQTLEVQVLVVGLNPKLSEIPTLETSFASMDIDLIGISNNNNSSAAVAFISYHNLERILSPSFFSTDQTTEKFLISNVVSASLPKTTNKELTKPVNITFKHFRNVDPEDDLSCVSWKKTRWVEDGCTIQKINISHTMCSCVHLSTLALIMHINPDRMSNSEQGTILIKPYGSILPVGLVFLSLSILTFAFRFHTNKVTNVALINLCTNLLLHQLVDLVIPTRKVQNEILYTVLIGLESFVVISYFMWMLIEAVLLFIFVKNLSKFRSEQATISWKCLMVIGYAIPVLVFVSSSVIHRVFDKERCWILDETPTDSILLTVIISIVATNLFLYIITIIIMIITLRKLKNVVVQSSNEVNKRLILSVIFKSLAQFFVYGCYWILFFFKPSGMTFQILHTQQGTFIFLIHCVLNQEVRQMYWRFLKALWLYKRSRRQLEHPVNNQ